MAEDSANIIRLALQNNTFDPVRLAQLRKGLRDEEARNLEMERQFPGRSFSGASRSDLAGLDADIADDPYTGTDETARVQKRADTLDAAAMYERPEIGDASKTKAKRDAFSAFMLDTAPYLAQTSPAGKAALDAASGRKIGENRALWEAKDSAGKLSSEGDKTLLALHEAQPIAQRLHKLLTEKIAESPDAQVDATQGDSVGGVIRQIPDVATSQAKRVLYGLGFQQPPGKYDEIARLADMLKVIGSRGYLGSVRNMEWVNQIQDHLTNGRLPDKANLERLQGFLQTGPEIEQAIYDVEKGHKRLDAAPGAAGAAATLAPGAAGGDARYRAYVAGR